MLSQDAAIVDWDEDDGLWVYRGSALGSCPKALLQARLGHPAEPPPKFLLEKFEEGKVGEPLIVNAMKDAGWGFQSQQESLEINVMKGVVVRVHPDGIASLDGSDWHVVEIKLLGESMYKDWCNRGWNIKGTYNWQFAIEMSATGMPGVHVAAMKDQHGNVILDSVKYQYQKYPHPITGRQIQRRVALIEQKARQIEAGEAKLEEIAHCPTAEWPCGYYTTQGNACNGKKDMDTIDEEAANELAVYVERYRNALEDEGRAKTIKDDARARVLSVMEAQGAKTVEVGKNVVTWKTGGPGNVSWKAVASHLNDDDPFHDVLLDKYRGKDKPATVTIKEIDNEG
jgi:hypothetical protein